MRGFFWLPFALSHIRLVGINVWLSVECDDGRATILFTVCDDAYLLKSWLVFYFYAYFYAFTIDILRSPPPPEVLVDCLETLDVSLKSQNNWPFSWIQISVLHFTHVCTVYILSGWSLAVRAIYHIHFVRNNNYLSFCTIERANTQAEQSRNKSVKWKRNPVIVHKICNANMTQWMWQLLWNEKRNRITE